MIKRRTLSTAVFLCSYPFLSAHSAFATDAKIQGSITDHSNRLPGALVKVVGTNQSTVTDYDGKFELAKLDPGHYQLEVSYMGYSSQIVDVEISNNEVKLLSPIVMDNSANTIEEVVAVGQIQRGEMAAANSQKNAKRY